MSPSPQRPHTRRDKVTDAAIVIIAERGLRGLTHRAIDAQAGLPLGSASSCFRTRKALIDGVVERIAVLDEEVIAALPAGWWRHRQDAIEALTDLLDNMLNQSRSRTHARMVLYLDATAAHDSQARYAEASARFLDRVTQVMAWQGFSRPGQTARLFVTLLDGVLFGALARPFYGATDRDWLRESVTAVMGAVAPSNGS